MTRNTLVDLNNHLFEALERMNDVDLDGEDLETEMKRCKTITGLAGAIINNANTILNAQKYATEYAKEKELPTMLQAGKQDQLEKK